jgi:hypothetical protein
MAANITTGDAKDNSWTLRTYYTGTLDGLSGTDTLSVGTLSRSNFTLKQLSDGSIELDTIGGASRYPASQITLVNMEVLKYNSDSAQIDLTTYFPAITSFSPPDGANNVAVDSDLTLTFNKPVQKGNGDIAIHVDSPTGSILETF